MKLKLFKKGLQLSIIFTKSIFLPEWVSNINVEKEYYTDLDKMKLVINLSKQNIMQETGGPFGAAIFDLKTNKIVSIGVNTVVSQNCSINHAEIIAIILAQEKLKSYCLYFVKNEYALFSSAQPCAMCYGSIIWSGIKNVVFSASRNDVINSLGFDEGPLPNNWVKELNNRGIKITSGLLVQEAVKVLNLYKFKNGVIY